MPRGTRPKKPGQPASVDSRPPPIAESHPAPEEGSGSHWTRDEPQRRGSHYWSQVPGDPLDLLAELELYPDGRPDEAAEPAAAPSWTLAEAPMPAARRRAITPLELWPPAVDEEAARLAEAEAAAEQWRRAPSVLEAAPGHWQLESSPDEPRGAVRPHLTSVGVGRVSTLDSLVASLQHRYRGVLETLERDALTRPPPEELRLTLPALTAVDQPLETPGREHLQFARTCLEQLNTTLLTGPFNHSPELEEPADLLRAALRQLVSTAAALHHELELRSMAHSRHRLLLQALHRRLQIQYQAKMTEVITEVRAQRQLEMERLSGQIEVNMALVHKLTQYVAQAERVSAGRGRVQNIYVRLMDLTTLKRQEVLMYRALLLDASEHTEQLRSQMKLMRRSMADLIRSDSLHELLSEQFTDEVEEELVLLQDSVTQTQTETEKKKQQLRQVVLRKNKAVQLERRLRQRTDPLRRELGRLGTLTADAQESTEDRYRSFATLTQRWSEVHEKVQTARISVRNTMHLLDTHVLEQLEMEGEAAEMDISPLIQEIQLLEEELKVAKKREHEARGRHADLRRRRQSLTSDRNKMRVTVADTLDSISGALKDMENMEADHLTVMTLLKEQMELANEMLVTSRRKLAEINRLQGIVDLDLDTLRERVGALYSSLVSRQQETDAILADVHARTEGALKVRDMLKEVTEEELDILQHLQVVVAELKDGKQPAILKAQARLEHLSTQTKKLEELKERQTERLVEQRARTAERAQQAAELQQQVEEMELRKREQELEKAELIEKRRQKTSEIAGYRSTVEMTQSSYAELSQRQSLEQLQQEELIVVLRSWCRQVALCNGGYQLEISRMERELKAFYEQLERNVQQEIELSRVKMQEAETELRQLTKLHNQKNAESLERDWQLRAALLATSKAGERSLKPVQKAMAGLDVERRKLVKMVGIAVDMRPFSKVEIKIEQPVCPLPKEDL
ncbi:plectin-like [Amphibalanus amphitrite]|uniref:plectin-like n=1 Tax=Amphibalanus amphitrite TaxID=1232801 RepID=UPI001C928B8D|nr:plectin-like [Amphibalanus amphitrite]